MSWFASTGLLCDLLWSDPEKEIAGWGENDRGVSFTFGQDVVHNFLRKHDLDLICRAHQVIGHRRVHFMHFFIWVFLSSIPSVATWIFLALQIIRLTGAHYSYALLVPMVAFMLLVLRITFSFVAVGSLFLFFPSYYSPAVSQASSYMSFATSK